MDTAGNPSLSEISCMLFDTGARSSVAAPQSGVLRRVSQYRTALLLWIPDRLDENIGAEMIENLSALSGVVYEKLGAIFPFLVAPTPAPTQEE